MSFDVKRLARELSRERRQKKVVKAYSEHERFIRPDIYRELKRKKLCQVCKQKKHLFIHHKMPVKFGGSNERSNLMAVCKECHAVLDAAAEKKVPESVK